MGITQVIDPFYQSVDLRALKNRPVVGQFCWIAVPHIDKIPRIMEVERENPTEHYATKFKIRNMTDQDFRRKQKLPIWSLTLRETEELLIQKAKKRLAITVMAENTIFDDINDTVSVGSTCKKTTYSGCRSMALSRQGMKVDSLP